MRIVSEDTEQFDRAAQILNIIGTYRKIYFHLALGATALSDIDGASAAGASAAARKLTPKLDAEALVSGRTALGEPLPRLTGRNYLACCNHARMSKLDRPQTKYYRLRHIRATRDGARSD